jgi:hypothetical protein
MSESLENKDSTKRIPDISSLKAELQTIRENQRIRLDTTSGSVEGRVTFISGDYRSFSMELSKPENLAGAHVDFLLEGALTGTVPEGKSVAKNFRMSGLMRDGSPMSQQWTGEIKDLNVIQ